MLHVIARSGLGGAFNTYRDSFTTVRVPGLQAALEFRPMTTSMMRDLWRRSREVLGGASWFASDSRLLLDCCLLHGQTTLGAYLQSAAFPRSDQRITLGGASLAVTHGAQREPRDVTVWIGGWCCALAARDAATLRGLSNVDEAEMRQAPANVDEYQYAWMRALRALPLQPELCLAELDGARRLWKEREIADERAATVDRNSFDLASALVTRDAAKFSDCLARVLRAHQDCWSEPDDHLKPHAWVAIGALGLACVAHDRGLPISVESDYIPQCLVKNQFVTPSPLRLPNVDDPPPIQPPPANKVAEKTREIALLAAQAWADARLVPAGYTLIGTKRESGFDFLYSTPQEEIAIIDSLAGDEQLTSMRSSDGTICEQGSLAYLLSVLEKNESTAPELVERIRTALAKGRLRYFEVRQPIAESGKLGQCEARQFAL